jgi:HNH endonuclease
VTRGKKSRVGSTRVAPNGYHYTRIQDGWVLTHRLNIERHMGRKLNYDERVKFKDGDRNNTDVSNLEVFTVKKGSNEKKRARLEARIEDLQAQLAELDQ